ncbi:MAG: hypothetical protein MJA29_02525 [Candidatus Omnitrophica bacterium]|nr:hypothetical protein [Candidatus Omnitrophota bacterium]
MKKEEGKISFTPEEESHLISAFEKNLPEDKKVLPKGAGSCSCSGCSCPPGGGDICDGGTYVGYAGGYFGALSVHV